MRRVRGLVRPVFRRAGAAGSVGTGTAAHRGTRVSYVRARRGTPAPPPPGIILPTLLAPVGEPDIKEKLLAGYSAMGRDYKIHLDGYNLRPCLKGAVKGDPCREFLYWTDGGNLAALRYGQWKLASSNSGCTFDVWEEPFVQLRVPKLFTLRGDPALRRMRRGQDLEKSIEGSRRPARRGRGRRPRLHELPQGAPRQDPLDQSLGASQRRDQAPHRGGRHLPNAAAITRLVGAILLEQNDQWAVQRARYMTLETIAPLRDDLTLMLPAAAASTKATRPAIKFPAAQILHHV